VRSAVHVVPPSPGGITLRSTCLAAASVAVLIGCSASTQGQIDTLRAQEQLEGARLDAIRREIAASELQAQKARVRADFEECRSNAASLRAEATVAIATCQEELARHGECNAQNASRAANSSVTGCLGGILLAGLTGGTAFPIALGGCALGAAAGGASADQCPTVQCSVDPSTALAAALGAHQLTRFPICGGVMGIGLEPQLARITYVLPGSPAAAAGLAPGDVIIRLENNPIGSGSALALAVEEHPPLDVVRVGFVRQNLYNEVPVTLVARQQ
jgi:PDZ domain